ncbi:hypothetical protein K438DRAFT_1953257 [Mycena galopus ATCC 62051]|nr:hypothetical protein K438DRAFT_1953257 [Mycena galopus ATCC 62051]
MSLLKLNPERINDIAHYVAPRASNGQSKDPQLILIFGWLGATLSQLIKYSTRYSEFYPAAFQVLIECDMVRGEIESRTANINQHKPILQKLAQLGLFGEMPLRILIHVFSSGGAIRLLWFAHALESTTQQPVETQSSTCIVVIDSSPGSLLLPDVRAALAHSLTGFQRFLGSAAISAMYTGLRARSAMTGRPMMHDFVRGGLSDPHIFPWTDTSTPRLYLYSDADQTALASDVKKHIQEAKEKGLNIREEYFLGSEHVQHSKRHPERYWRAILSTWDETVRSKL